MPSVGCAVRTIQIKELRFPNGAHGAPYIVFTVARMERSGIREYGATQPRITFHFIRATCCGNFRVVLWSVWFIC